MPCKDSSSVMNVRLDNEDRLIDFKFNKITCAKTIGGTGYLNYCAGMNVDQIREINFTEVVQDLQLTETEDQFLLYLEWEALRAAITQYKGWDDEIDSERYQIASISQDENSVEISQVISPPREIPKIIPCRVRSRQSEN